MSYNYSLLEDFKKDFMNRCEMIDNQLTTARYDLFDLFVNSYVSDCTMYYVACNVDLINVPGYINNFKRGSFNHIMSENPETVTESSKKFAQNIVYYGEMRYIRQILFEISPQRLAERYVAMRCNPKKIANLIALGQIDLNGDEDPFTILD